MTANNGRVILNPDLERPAELWAALKHRLPLSCRSHNVAERRHDQRREKGEKDQSVQPCFPHSFLSLGGGRGSGFPKKLPIYQLSTALQVQHRQLTHNTQEGHCALAAGHCGSCIHSGPTQLHVAKVHDFRYDLLHFILTYMGREAIHKLSYFITG